VHACRTWQEAGCWLCGSHLTIKATRAQQGGVQDVSPVGGGNHNDAWTGQMEEWQGHTAAY